MLATRLVRVNRELRLPTEGVLGARMAGLGVRLWAVAPPMTPVGDGHSTLPA